MYNVYTYIPNIINARCMSLEDDFNCHLEYCFQNIINNDCNKHNPRS